MRKWMALALSLAFCIGFFGFLYAMPYLRTHRIIGLITRQTYRENFLFRVPRLDHTERRVQRVSPDLHYSYCLINLENSRRIRLKLAEWPYYQSVGFYKLNGDYVASWHPDKTQEIIISQEGTDPSQWRILEERGLLIIRRLVPQGTVPPTSDSCEALHA